MWRPGVSSWLSSLGNKGRVYAPVRRVTTRWIRSCREVEEVGAADGCTQSLGGVKTPGALVEASVSVVPGVSVPVWVVESVSVPVSTVASVVPVCGCRGACTPPC